MKNHNEEVSECCVVCNHSTAFGSGLYVNRIPADSNAEHEGIGWMCHGCQCEPCDRCGTETADYEFLPNTEDHMVTDTVCMKCLDANETPS